VKNAKDIAAKIMGFILLAGDLSAVFFIITIPFELVPKLNAEHWPSRKGVITTSYTHRVRGNGSKSNSSYWWKVEVAGTYKESGEKFYISRVRFGGFRWGEGKKQAEDVIARYPVGKEIDVYYNPDNPKETILEPLSSWKEISIMASIAVGFPLITFLIWLFRRRIEPQTYAST